MQLDKHMFYREEKNMLEKLKPNVTSINNKIFYI